MEKLNTLKVCTTRQHFHMTEVKKKKNSCIFLSGSHAYFRSNSNTYAQLATSLNYMTH